MIEQIPEQNVWQHIQTLQPTVGHTLDDLTLQEIKEYEEELERWLDSKEARETMDRLSDEDRQFYIDYHTKFVKWFSSLSDDQKVVQFKKIKRNNKNWNETIKAFKIAGILFLAYLTLAIIVSII